MTTYEENEKKLLELATAEFGKLTEAEEKLFRSVVYPATAADYSDYSAAAKLLRSDIDPSILFYSDPKTIRQDIINPELDKTTIARLRTDFHSSNCPKGAAQWSKERTLKADRVTWLCLDEDVRKLIQHTGIFIFGALIDGEIRLEFADIPFQLCMMKCSIKSPLLLQHASIAALNLSGSHTSEVFADRLNVRGIVFLRDGFRANGEVKLLGAKIGGYLDCSGGQFVNKAGDALSADRIDVYHDVRMSEGFKAEGVVRFLHAKVGGNIDLSGARIIHGRKEQTTFAADSINVKGNILLDQGFHSEGKVRLIGATISGDLSCSGGAFHHSPGKRRALSLDRIRIGGNLTMDQGFQSVGQISLINASIGGTLSCRGGSLVNPGGIALMAEGMDLRRDVVMERQSYVNGQLCLCRARIGGLASVADLNSSSCHSLDLRQANITTIRWDADSWPEQGSVKLDGLKYERIKPATAIDVRGLIKWLQRQYNHPEELRSGFPLLLSWAWRPIKRLYDWSARRENESGKALRKDELSPQPYEQLAEVLRQEGREDHAKEVQVAKNWDWLCFKSCDSEWAIFHPMLIVRWLFGAIIGFGYRPWRALYWIAGLIFIGFLVFGHAFRVNGMVQTKTWDAVNAMQATELVESTNEAPQSALLYSIDSFVPLANLRHAEYWQPDPAICPIVNAYLCLHIVGGWALTALFAVGLTGLVKS